MSPLFHRFGEHAACFISQMETLKPKGEKNLAPGQETKAQRDWCAQSRRPGGGPRLLVPWAQARGVRGSGWGSGQVELQDFGLLTGS